MNSLKFCMKLFVSDIYVSELINGMKKIEIKIIRNIINVSI